MLDDLATFFSLRLTPGDDHHGDRAAAEFRYAAAALMVVCAKADFHDHPEEEKEIVELLERTFDIEHELIEELIGVLDEDTLVRGIHQLTGLVNRLYTLEDKMALVENLWKVAFADGHLDRFEEQFINRVAFMIRLGASDVANCRKAVEEEGS